MSSESTPSGVTAFYSQRLDELELRVREKSETLARLQAQRNTLNSKGMSEHQGQAFTLLIWLGEHTSVL